MKNKYSYTDEMKKVYNALEEYASTYGLENFKIRLIYILNSFDTATLKALRSYLINVDTPVSKIISSDLSFMFDGEFLDITDECTDVNKIISL